MDKFLIAKVAEFVEVKYKGELIKRTESVTPIILGSSRGHTPDEAVKKFSDKSEIHEDLLSAYQLASDGPMHYAYKEEIKFFLRNYYFNEEQHDLILENIEGIAETLVHNDEDFGSKTLSYMNEFVEEHLINN
ncbi:hypothetical protein [Pontibacillus halophilus]|uniref:hypothetical protein n=1 Tax=Pontibacillus halophilus TaxID=516704 RepID=UPI000425EC1F|nr:hypothetical protein [Pontibacillus halophilus]